MWRYGRRSSCGHLVICVHSDPGGFDFGPKCLYGKELYYNGILLHYNARIRFFRGIMIRRYRTGRESGRGMNKRKPA